MKVLFKQELVENKIVEQLSKEIELQSRIRHKYILRLRFLGQDDARVYLYMDIAHHGNLYNFLRRLNKFPEDICGKYLRQLLNALTYLHEIQIMHRDIKPENLMLSSNGDLLLGDFGWSNYFNNSDRWTICGTPEYLPPEMISRQQHSQDVDSWTCGVLCYEFLTGETPFKGQVLNVS